MIGAIPPDNTGYIGCAVVGVLALCVCFGLLIWAVIWGLLAERRAKEAKARERAAASQPEPLLRLIKK